MRHVSVRKYLRYLNLKTYLYKLFCIFFKEQIDERRRQDFYAGKRSLDYETFDIYFYKKKMTHILMDFFKSHYNRPSMQRSNFKIRVSERSRP